MLSRRLVYFLLTFTLISGLALYFYFNQTVGNVSVIVLGETGYSPQNVVIKAGDTIEFKTERNQPFWPASDLHPTHGVYPEFDPQEPIDPGSSWKFQFNKPGSWKYHDHLDPFFRGSITVE